MGVAPLPHLARSVGLVAELIHVTCARYLSHVPQEIAVLAYLRLRASISIAVQASVKHEGSAIVSNVHGKATFLVPLSCCFGEAGLVVVELKHNCGGIGNVGELIVYGVQPPNEVRNLIIVC
jgi:hypothetical protein